MTTRSACALVAPLETLAHPWEGALIGDTLAPCFGFEVWPPAEFSHEQFLRDRQHAGWLAWQLTRPLVKVEKPKAKRPAKPTGKQRPRVVR